MNEKESFPKPIEAFLVIIASFFFVVLIIQAFIFIFLPDPQQISQSSTSLKILITFGEIGLIVIPLIYVRRTNLQLRKVFRWNTIPINMIIWSIIIGFSISIIGDELDRLMNLIIPAPEFLGEISEALQILSFSDFIVFCS